MKDKSVNVEQFNFNSTPGSKGLIERWETFIPRRAMTDVRPGYRALGLFRTDSVNFSLHEAQQKRLRDYFLDL